MLINGIDLGEISNVRKSGDEENVYFVDIMISPQEGFPPEKMIFCARANDYAATGKYVMQQINEGNFVGEMIQLLPGADPETGIVPEPSTQISPTVTGAQTL